jgi:hypothetical protein
MKILLFACVYGRPEISKIFALGIERLKKDFDILPLTVCSTDEDFDLCVKLDLNPIMRNNRPLGVKHNEGLSHAFYKEWDKMLLMGSDNLISSEGLHLLTKSRSHHVGFRKMYALDKGTKQAMIHEYHEGTRLIGAGRLIDRHALELSSDRVRFSFSKGGDQIMSFKAAKRFESLKIGKGRDRIQGLWEGSRNNCLDESYDYNLTRSISSTLKQRTTFTSTAQ